RGGGCVGGPGGAGLRLGSGRSAGQRGGADGAGDGGGARGTGGGLSDAAADAAGGGAEAGAATGAGDGPGAGFRGPEGDLWLDPERHAEGDGGAAGRRVPRAGTAVETGGADVPRRAA